MAFGGRVVSEKRPMVLDGEFTKWFWEDVAAMDRAAQSKADGKPKCRVCDRPMWLDQPKAHYICSGLIS